MTVQSFIKNHPEADNGEPFGMAPLPAGAPKLNRLCDFMAGPFSTLDHTPELGSIARQSLVRALSIALRDESQKELRYEAAQIIIQAGLFSEMGRWDAILLKNILVEMLKDGNETNKDIACSYFCHLNILDETILEHLKTGLGDVNDTRRQQLNEIIANLDLKYASEVISMLIDEAVNANFRIRMDVIQQLTGYVQRLNAPLNERPASAIHRETSSATSSVAKLVTAPISSTKSALEPGDPNVSQEDIDEFEKLDNLVFASVDMLLRLMWEDWSSQVRDMASASLGELGKGSAIFDRIVRLLQSQDPSKRVDALKCLGYMGVMTDPAMSALIACFQDAYSAVRVEACKVACALRSSHRELIQALLDRLGDYEWKVRAFAVKGMYSSP